MLHVVRAKLVSRKKCSILFREKVLDNFKKIEKKVLDFLSKNVQVFHKNSKNQFQVFKTEKCIQFLNLETFLVGSATFFRVILMSLIEVQNVFLMINFDV